MNVKITICSAYKVRMALPCLSAPTGAGGMAARSSCGRIGAIADDPATDVIYCTKPGWEPSLQKGGSF